MVSNIQKRVMRRVTTVYYLRKVLNRFVLKSVILVLGALAFGSLVHVAAVFGNMPSITNVSSLYNFSYYAFVHTGVLVQAVIVLLGAVTLWLARDVLKQLIPKSKLQYSHQTV